MISFLKILWVVWLYNGFFIFIVCTIQTITKQKNKCFKVGFLRVTNETLEK